MCDAVGDPADHERKWKHEASLTDVLIASVILAEALNAPERQVVVADGINAFLTVKLGAAECAPLLAPAERQIALVHEALA
jgi:hypothetical protein